MSFSIRTTKDFDRSAKRLAKRHRSLKTDLQALVKSLQENPFQGVELFPGLRKIRMAIQSKGGGKSGGARVITYTLILAEDDGQVYLMDIYDKADYATADVNVMKKILKDLDLP